MRMLCTSYCFVSYVASFFGARTGNPRGLTRPSLSKAQKNMSVDLAQCIEYL